MQCHAWAGRWACAAACLGPAMACSGQPSQSAFDDAGSLGGRDSGSSDAGGSGAVAGAAGTGGSANTAGAGGATATAGGSSGSGARAGSGGAPGSGGLESSGGTGSGGTLGSSGSPGSGGIASSGGTSGSGGIGASGGSGGGVATGGAPGSGGASASGGSTGIGGLDASVDGGGAPDCGSCALPCFDGVKDGTESDIDCGGACAPCAMGKTCVSATDCASAACSAQGNCVECTTASQCPAPAMCQQTTCINDACGQAPAVAGTPCVGGACDSTGSCVGEWAAPSVVASVGSTPRVGFAPSGNGFISWSTTSPRSVVASRFGTTGGFTAPETVGDYGEYDISVGGDGVAVVVGIVSGGSPPLVYAHASLTPTGWSAATPIDPPATQSTVQQQAHVATDSAGNAVAASIQVDVVTGTDYFNLWGAQFVQGTGWQAASLLEKIGTADATGVELAMNPAGNAVVAWDMTDHTNALTPHRVLYSRTFAAGSWSTTTTKHLDVAAPSETSVEDVAIADDGTSILLYDRNRTSSTSRTLWATVGGPPWSAPAEVLPVTTDHAPGGWVRMGASNSAIAIWRQQKSGRPDQIWANRFVEGAGWEGAVRVDTRGGATGVSLAQDGAGNAIAAWSEAGSVRSDIFVARYTVGIGWGSPVLVAHDDALDLYHPDVGMSSNGDAVLAWDAYDGTSFRIMASRLK